MEIMLPFKKYYRITLTISCYRNLSAEQLGTLEFFKNSEFLLDISQYHEILFKCLEPYNILKRHFRGELYLTPSFRTARK